MQMENIGDFLYTIFHEIRHEEQMSKFKISNPLTGQLEDFEKLFKEYWKLELDADEFAKRKISELILNLNIPVDITKKNFRLSPYVENYPSASKMIENHLRMVVTDIKNMKKSGMEYSDIADHPIVKNHLEKLEEFF
jgi:DNA-directed RNA polymerase sigma subunit (sigma70/sigma32)